MTPTAVAQSIELFRERFVRITGEVGRRIVDPDAADIHHKIAQFYVRKHKVQDAISELRDAVVASPADEKLQPPHSYIIVVTDSFNDPPAKNDPRMADYLKYYDPKSLTRYPDTPENRDYERLLQKRLAFSRIRLVAGNLTDGHRAEDVFQLFAEQRRPIEGDRFYGHKVRAVFETLPGSKCPRGKAA